MKLRFISALIIKVKATTAKTKNKQTRHGTGLKSVEASCGCPKYANDVYMNIHNPNPNPNPNPN